MSSVKRQTRLLTGLVVLSVPALALTGIHSFCDERADDRAAQLQTLRNHGAVIVLSADGQRVKSLTFADNRVNVEALTLLPGLEPIDELSFDACPVVVDDFLAVVGRLKSLQTLNLGGTRITDEGLKQLRELKELRKLFLWRTRITDVGLRQLAGLPKLAVLNLWDVPITDACISDVFARLPSLKKLYLGTSPRPATVFEPGVHRFGRSYITEEGVRELAELRPELSVVFWSAESPEAPSGSALTSASSAVQTEIVSAPSAGELSRLQDSPGWPAFLGPEGQGISPEPVELDSWEIRKPALRWKCSIGEGLSAPSLSGDFLIYTHRVKNTEQVVCLRQDSGDTVWIASLPTGYVDALGYSNGPRSTPCIDDGLLYVVTAEGVLCCLDISDGHMVWQVETAAMFHVDENLYGVGSSPVICEDLVLLVVGGVVPNGDGGEPAACVAFEKKSGRLRYATGPFRASYASIRVLQTEPPLGVAFLREGAFVFNARNGAGTGAYPWAARVSGCVNAATPVVHGRQFLISEAYGPGAALLEVHTDGIREIWRDPERSRLRSLRAHWATPILLDGYVYGCSGRHSSEGQIRCVQWSTGRVMWAVRQGVLSSLCCVDHKLINLTERGTLELIDPSPSRWNRIGQFTPNESGIHQTAPDARLLKYPCWTAPVFSRGRLYVRGRDRLVCLDMPVRKE